MRSQVLAVSGLLLGLAACGDPCKESGTVCTIMGTGSPGANEAATAATETPLYGPMDVAIVGSASEYYVGDWNNHKIRHVVDGEASVAVGTVFLGDGDPEFQERIAPGVPGTTVALNHPTQLEWNPVSQKLLLPSWHNHRVREYTPSTGNSLVVCANTDITDGNGANAGFAGDGGPAEDALFAFPNSIAIDESDGSFWILDQRNDRLRKVAEDYSLIDTVAGNGEEAYAGDGGDPLEASFNFWSRDDLQPEPSGAVEYDQDGRLYIADTSNHVIRMIDLDAGIITTLAGTGECSADALCYPRDVELGPDGLLYVADAGNHVIRTVDPSTGEMSIVVGTGEQGDAEEGALALEAPLNQPNGIDIAPDGTLLIADTFNHRIRKVTP